MLEQLVWADPSRLKIFGDGRAVGGAISPAAAIPAGALAALPDG